MSVLEKRIIEYASKDGRALYKPRSYAAIYENFLHHLCGMSVVLVEIGIGFGGCLEVWKEYLGPEAMIYGIEKTIHAKVLEVQGPGIKIIEGDQSSDEFLAMLPERIPTMDVLIDDGSHKNADQIKTFEALFMHLASGGIYFCEDTHTSYREVSYGGGYKSAGSFIEYCKTIIDAMHYTEDIRILSDNTKLCWLANKIESIHFFRTMVVIKKKEQL